MSTKYILALASALAAATPATAQVVPNYSGPRVEGRIGYEFVNSGVRSTQEFGERGFFGADSSGEGPFIGAEVGYDARLSGVVVGAYAGFDYADTNIRSVNNPAEFKAKGNFTLGARAGIPLDAGVMLYAKAGYSRGKLKVDLLPGASPELFEGFDENRDGYHLGGGVELPILSQLYVRTDYTYTRFNDFERSDTQEIRFRRHQLSAAIGLRF